MRARVLVAGCGAVGGTFAARPAPVCEVAVLDPWMEHVAAISARAPAAGGRA